MKSTATKAAPNTQELPVKVTFNPLALRAANDAAKGELTGLEGATVDDDDDARYANQLLRAQLGALDSVEKMQAETLAPLKETEKRVKALFDPTLKPLRSIVATLRGLLEGYEKRKLVAQREALQLAAKAATAPTSDELHEALVAAEDAAPTQLEGTSFVKTWKVKRYAANCTAPDGTHRHAMTMIPDQFWIIDEKALARIGRENKGDAPPSVAGVVWEEELSSRVRR